MSVVLQAMHVHPSVLCLLREVPQSLLATPMGSMNVQAAADAWHARIMPVRLLHAAGQHNRHLSLLPAQCVLANCLSLQRMRCVLCLFKVHQHTY